MNVIDKTLSNDIELGALLAALDAHADSPLVFRYDGHDVKAGYHVTEVKTGRFDALDCGANPESWTEIFVQLWDIDEDGRTHMLSEKFAKIIRKVSEHVGLPMSAKLTFEVSDGTAPMALYCAAPPRIAAGRVSVELAPRPASCKPRDPWLVEEKAKSVCCAPSANQSCCA
ncbi:hypothetical protein HFO88_26400 [Rhizobium leguminosarum]|uniref:DUF6428 family protein n=1 Tax=Rhizobium leguminosarum TaxID=384 RepID=UPI001C9864F5|nr:DUF6428 family protein [Rhizobium leguminosarum]MBY5903850.1 hypothetical protein [Rhizobium leguminosarum]MBY5911053.1 hypothetical protein [Rhizobium leguminosarum]